MMGRPARPAQYSTSVYDYENNRYYHTTAAAEGNLDNCSWGDMDHIVGRNMFGAEDNSAHITSTAEVLNFGGRREETYDGTAMVRGIPCDKWINVVARLPTNESDAFFNMTTEYYFSVDGYDIPEADGQRIPIRFRIFGIRSETNYTTGEVIGSHEFDHIYDYTSFHVGPSSASIFSQPCGISCYSTNATWDDTVLDPTPCPEACPVPEGSIQVPPTVHSGPPPPPSIPDGVFESQIAVVADAAVAVFGSPHRFFFERAFKEGLIAQLEGVSEDNVVIVDINPDMGSTLDSIIVEFFVSDPPNGLDDAVGRVTQISDCIPLVSSSCDLQGDLNGDGIIQIDDLLMMLSAFNVRC